MVRVSVVLCCVLLVRIVLVCTCVSVAMRVNGWVGGCLCMVLVLVTIARGGTTLSFAFVVVSPWFR